MQMTLVLECIRCLHCDLVLVETMPAFLLTHYCKIQGCDDCDNMVQHDCLTYQGQSGSGMWSNTNHSIRAIVTGAITISDSTTVNVGIKLNAFVYNTISAWYREDASETLPGHTALAQAPAPAPGPATAPMAAIMAAPMAAPAAAPTPAMAPSGCVY